MINQQFVEHECMNYKYVNREEDTGVEGLRKAKLSYRPVFLVEKGVVTKIRIIKENDTMIAEKMKNMVANSSAIRAMFEEGIVWHRFMERRMCLILVLGTRMSRLRRL